MRLGNQKSFDDAKLLLPWLPINLYCGWLFQLDGDSGTLAKSDLFHRVAYIRLRLKEDSIAKTSISMSSIACLAAWDPPGPRPLGSWSPPQLDMFKTTRTEKGKIYLLIIQINIQPLVHMTTLTSQSFFTDIIAIKRLINCLGGR